MPADLVRLVLNRSVNVESGQCLQWCDTLSTPTSTEEGGGAGAAPTRWVRGGPGGSGVSFLWKLVRFLPASTLHPPTSLRPPGARRQRGRGFYGRAVVRRVCGHVARRLAYQRGQVCQERLAIEFPAVPAALPAPE